MEALSIRVLRNQPGRFEEVLARDRTVILNKDGRPFAIAIDVTEATLEQTVRLVTQLRAQLAVANMRSQAQERGLGEMPPDVVDAAIQGSRAARRE
jgi:hypothetical protein